MNNSSLRIAHLSDPHFSCVTYNLSQFLSKRWIGNFNLFFSRKHAYQTDHLWHIPELLKSLNVEQVFITGDFSSTSQDEEFSEGLKFLQDFHKQSLPTFVLPGNHDCYIKTIEKQRRFYSFFSSQALREKRVELFSLEKGWWYIGLDCAVATPPFCSYGVFLEKTEAYLREALIKIPSTDRVIIGNHFPLYATGRPLHDLKRAKELQSLLKEFRQVKLYLHGHDHDLYIIDRQNEGLPLVLNCGSCAHKPDGTLYLIELFEQECLVQRLLFRKDREGFSWNIDWQKHYALSPPCS